MAKLTPAQAFAMDCLQAAPGRSFRAVRYMWRLYEGDNRVKPFITVAADTLLVLEQMQLIQLNVDPPGTWDRYTLKESPDNGNIT